MWAIPTFIAIIFGLLAYYNVKQFSHRTVPIVRRRLEVQLTGLLIAARIRFINALLTCIYQCNFECPFYIYICVSGRFRKQLHYVLMVIYLNRCQRLARNRVLPDVQVIQPNGMRL
ncbi:unnamed protein product [Rotaria socialis]|uniref:Uncharacterized protein n=1 Tax=Rotaria socialis TaxID=392032 RepID=A0A821A1P2_9BILA|nr:unnamed protein product [Rotaria socialis]